jgi:hypothetical protein
MLHFTLLLPQQAEEEIRTAADEALLRIQATNKPTTTDLEVYRNCVIFSFTILKGSCFTLIIQEVCLHYG